MPDFSTMPKILVSSADLAAAVSREGSLGVCARDRIPAVHNLKEQPEKLVQRNLWLLMDSYLPVALIADRTALENETEVKVIDRNKLEIVESVGCRVREACT